MEVHKVKPAYKDGRGVITDIMMKEPIEYVTLISSKKGAIRGNHYHKDTFQWVYILSGQMKLFTQMPDEEVQSTILDRGAIALTPPLERHAFIALRDTKFMVFTKGPRGGEDYEKDTFRLKVPLVS